ncbi:DUF3368 domain-containing protein [Nostoc spongiaeforme FACHB-130]|uniref:DUF3368 domain-containing protein n=1 Tax=Nostoc spongiaeforme FACHB-130 TaxID=1357510 RepID=A0ABR8G4W3_9NOSO|nr:DUF3368 domain-containing protein [Nostoc spongiaeforme]MBD2598207.1 DUF3368 domain-containing protein [Nostoc spongiaeforme FACHB-130]
MIKKTVTNSTCLIGLERIGRLDILPQVFFPVIIPCAVAAEVGLSAEWLTVQAVKNLAVVTTLKTQIDSGEAEAIALAMEIEDVFIILDDRNARRIAQQLSLKVIGTVGMLLRAKQQGIIAEIKPLLTALEAADFRIAEPLVQNALRLAGEL